MGKDISKQLEKIATEMIKQAVNKALKTHVAPEAQSTLRRHIQSDVYDAQKNFSKKTSKKRTENMIAKENNVIEFDEKNLSFTLYNKTEPESIFGSPITAYNSDNTIFGYWIETGKVPVLWDDGRDGYINRKSPLEIVGKKGRNEGVIFTVNRNFPKRPFVKRTKAELSKNDNKILKDALKEGLKQQGIEIK